MDIIVAIFVAIAQSLFLVLMLMFSPLVSLPLGWAIARSDGDLAMD
jgi:hypothetical protein